MDYDIEEFAVPLPPPSRYKRGNDERGSIPRLDEDDRALAWKILGGWQFNEHFSAEVTYVDARKDNVDVSAYTLAMVGWWPVTSDVTFFIKGGGSSLSVSDGDLKDDSVSYVVGAGAEFEVTDNLSLRAEWERLDANGSIDFLSLGLLYHF